MQTLDWILFLGFLAYIIWDGVRRAGTQHGAEDYFMAGRSVPWWAAGLSIMATQASAITMVGTTGQGWADGLRFVQFYFALPLAMVIIAIWVVPAYHRLQVHTAYEYLGIRFDEKTRVLSASLFLVLRCLSVGFVIYTPSLVLSKVFGLPLPGTILVMGGVAVFYTSLGGLGAVISTDVKQMTVMALGIVVAFFIVGRDVDQLVGFAGARAIAGEAGRLQILDWSWDPSEKYTVWSSLIGGLFLFLSYFGTDQSQAQRLLAAKSIRDARGALLFNAVFKLPFQFGVLLLGAMLFVFYTVSGTPIGFEPSASDPLAVPAAERTRYAELEAEYAEVEGRLREAALAVARVADGSDTADNMANNTAAIVTAANDTGGSDRVDKDALEKDALEKDALDKDTLGKDTLGSDAVGKVGGGELTSSEAAAGSAVSQYLELLGRSNELREEARTIRGGPADTNYVFLDFILGYLPVGVVGLLLAAIFAAALSSIDSEINSMATVAVLDIFARRRIRESTARGELILDGKDLLLPSRVATLLMGAFATAFALYVDVVGSLVEAVNAVGSYVYGSLLGAFVLAVAVPRANGTGAFLGLIAGMIAVALAARTGLAFLFLNTLGTVVVVLVGTVASVLVRVKPDEPGALPPAES